MLDVILAGSRQEINAQLALFKERNIIQFDLVLAIPRSERIPELIRLPDGRRNVSGALSASVMSAMQNINLRVGLTPDQIIELSEQIIDESEEDNLALEDVLLFLQQLISGKAGKIYDRMDIPTFFELFENYRQERYEKLQTIRYEQQVNQKSLGPLDRESENQDRMKELQRSALGDYLKQKYSEPENKNNSTENQP